MLILGIDPGSRITGFGLIEKKGSQYIYVASGCIKTKSQTFCQRLDEIHQGVYAIVQKYAPSQVAIEKIFLKENVDSAFKLGHARGAALVAIASHQLCVSEYAPRVIKKTVVGYGGADKKQIQQMVKILLGLSEVPQTDAADALAVAMCHAGHQR